MCSPKPLGQIKNGLIFDKISLYIKLNWNIKQNRNLAFDLDFSINLSPIFLVVQIQLVGLLVGLLVRLLVGKSYHTIQKDGYSLPTNDPTNNRTN